MSPLTEELSPVDPFRSVNAAYSSADAAADADAAGS